MEEKKIDVVHVDNVWELNVALAAQLAEKGMTQEAEEMLRACIAYGDMASAARAALHLGLLLMNRGDVAGADAALCRALLADDPEVSVRAGLNLGRARMEMSNANVASSLPPGSPESELAAYEANLKIFDVIGDRANEGVTLHKMGTVYHAQNRYDAAEQAYKQSLVLSREVKHPLTESSTLANLGMVYSAQGRHEETAAALEQRLVALRSFQDRAGEIPTLSELGGVYRVLNRYDQARQAYEEALTMCRALQDRVSEGRTLRNIALLLEAQGSRAQALAYARQSVSVLTPGGEQGVLEAMRHLVAQLESGSAQTGRG